MNFATATTEKTARTKANKALAALANYHPFIPTGEIDAILAFHGFTPLEEAIYCGREGRTTCQVGLRTFLSLSWYKMETTGRYEIVAYLS